MCLNKTYGPVPLSEHKATEDGKEDASILQGWPNGAALSKQSLHGINV
jgi:hypothetical protein